MTQKEIAEVLNKLSIRWLAEVDEEGISLGQMNVKFKIEGFEDEYEILLVTNAKV